MIIIIIKKMKQRMTSQRREILKHLKNVCNHPSADSVFNAVKKNMPFITLATVYRNLNILSDNGDILKLMIDGEARFDGDISNHQHSYCTSCGRLTDVFYDGVCDSTIKKINSDGFNVNRIHVVFYGRCKKCEKGGKK